MLDHPQRVIRAAQPPIGREPVSEAHARRDGFPVEQGTAEPGLRLQGMTECVTEVEERAAPGGLTLIFGDNARLGGNAVRDRVCARVRTGIPPASAPCRAPFACVFPDEP